jgi:hypothetical protein
LTPPEVAREIASGVPGAQLIEIPESGHLSPLEQPAEVTAALLRRCRASCLFRARRCPPCSAPGWPAARRCSHQTSAAAPRSWALPASNAKNAAG